MAWDGHHPRGPTAPATRPAAAGAVHLTPFPTRASPVRRSASRRSGSVVQPVGIREVVSSFGHVLVDHTLPLSEIAVLDGLDDRSVPILGHHPRRPVRSAAYDRDADPALEVSPRVH